MSALTSAAARSWSMRLLVRERRLHLRLPGRVRRERVALRSGARGVQGEQLLGQVVDGLADALLGAQPFRPAELGQRRPLTARVARHPADLLDRHEDPVAAREGQLEVVAILARPAAPEHLLVAGHAVIDVDDQVAGRQPLEDVARHDPAERPRASDPDRPEQLAVGDERQAVRPADEPAVEAALDRGRPRRAAGRRRAGRRPRPACPPSPRSSARRGAWSEASTIRASSARQAGDRVQQASGTAGRQHRLPPAERVAGRQGAAGHRGVLGRLGFPGQLEGPRADEPALPVARRQVRGRPLLRQLAGLDELGAALVGLAPQERRGLGDVAGLVEDQERARADVVEAGRRGEVRGPDLGRIADDHRPAARRPSRGRAQSVSASASVSNRARSAASRSGEPGRRATEPVADRRRATGRQQELGGGQQQRTLDRADRALVGRVEGAQRIDLVAEELDPDRQRQRRREDVDDAAAPRQLAAAGDLGDRHVAEVEQLAQERVLVDPGAEPQLARGDRQVGRGDRVLEERLDAGAPSPVPGRACHAARAATRAAVSSAMSSLRS